MRIQSSQIPIPQIGRFTSHLMVSNFPAFLDSLPTSSPERGPLSYSTRRRRELSQSAFLLDVIYTFPLSLAQDLHIHSHRPFQVIPFLFSSASSSSSCS
ncbi:unnamed protein product [Protopolystoma xenopodis]|uniref:Uncharacterized protein n=1 Tax=Protopolystoma xenopodis TaxID=117903 RepID=A0A3S5A7Q9_9PLAT|nr:unnamed protein product [Protopolystoma xenopodis]